MTRMPLDRWRKPFPFKRFAILAVVLLALVAALNLAFLLTGEAGLHFTSLVLVILFALVFGFYALNSNVEEMTVYSLPIRNVAGQRIAASLDILAAHKGIKEELQLLLDRKFKGRHLHRRVFSLLDLRKADCYYFNGGELKLYLALGMGRIKLRLEWGNQESRQAAGVLKQAIRKIDFEKAADRNERLTPARD